MHHFRVKKTQQWTKLLAKPKYPNLEELGFFPQNENFNEKLGFVSF